MDDVKNGYDDSTTILKEKTEKFNPASPFTEQFGTFFNTTYNAVIVISPDGVILDANLHFQVKCGLSYPELINRPLKDFFDHESRMTLESAMGSLVKGKRRGTTLKLKLKNSEGNYLHAEMSIALLHHHQYSRDQVLMAVLSFDNITQRRHDDKTRKLYESISRSNHELQKTLEDLATSQSKLMEAQKLESIGLLASGLAHNLKTPLSGIKGYTQLLRMEHKELDELEMILKEVSVMESIIGNLMAKNRKAQTSEEENIHLNDLIRLELQFLESNLFFKHEVKTVLALDDNLPGVRGVYNHFSQIFMNIVQNALDAMCSTKIKELTISTRHDGQFVYIDIEDTGTGIPAAIRKDIFDVFFTTKSGPARPCQGEPVGTGLGLSTANYFVLQYGGKIDLVSEPGLGSRFTVCLPVCLENRNSETPRVLIVDDSATVVNVLVKACRKLGCETYGTQDSENGILLYKRLKPDLIITDLVMPKLSGCALMAQVREWNPVQKVIYMSGYVENPHFSEWLEKETEGPYSSIVPKPADWSILSKEIEQLLSMEALHDPVKVMQDPEPAMMGDDGSNGQRGDENVPHRVSAAITISAAG